MNTVGFAQISGIIFRDFNGNGTRQTAAGFVKPIVPVVVNACNSNDVQVASYTTTAGGFIPSLQADYVL